jgi:polysaccharide biosynthesis/export protein
VHEPGAVPIENGRLSLAQAIAEVGGLLPVEARKGSIKLIRGSWQEPTVYTLKYDTILEEGDKILLRAGDRIVVSPTGLTTLSRYMMQILPLLTGADTSLDIATKSKALGQ